ncbi:MAG: ATP-dependent RecD-like DNA helicase [Firmicutes bacterium]|nr:ATP-dependent RecD-like DNA helicase [Bacillota bacterium]
MEQNLKGVIKSVTYKGQGGFAVFELKTDEAAVSCVGFAGDVHDGMDAEVFGQFIIDPKYGNQFRVKRATLKKPTTMDAVKNYLGSGVIKGVGPATAGNIVKMFGKDTLKIIENEPQKLKAVKGISEKKAKEIGEQFSNLQEMQATIMYLQSAGMSINLALKIYKTYDPRDNTTFLARKKAGGGAVEDIVKRNPYRLVEDVDGVGFLTADKIARGLGLPADSKERARAGLVYTLKNAAISNGNTYLPKQKLIENTADLLKMPFGAMETMAKEILTGMQLDGAIKILNVSKATKKADETVGDSKLDSKVESIEAVASIEFYRTEKNIAHLLERLRDDFIPTQKEKDIQTLISEYERVNKITLHTTQKRAILEACINGVSIITGGPGTGKTTIIKGIIYVLGARALLDSDSVSKSTAYFSLCAPTGRAAKRLEESTKVEAKTIHRLLELDPSNRGGEIQPSLDTHCVIVDEVSMVDAFLMNHLVKRLKRGCALILVGDADQLASVGAGNILADILASKKFSTTRLTEIYRQSENSLIVTNAHLVNQGKMPKVDNKNATDFFFIEHISHQDILAETSRLVTERLPTHLNILPTDIQVLAPLKKGVCGVNNLNTQLQQLLNPPYTEKLGMWADSKEQVVKRQKKPQLEVGDMLLRVGDKVMHTENNYDLVWERGGLEGLGVFNGDIGFIIEINTDATSAKVEMEDGRVATYTKELLSQLMLAYAITVHKSQGSEWQAVVLPIVSAGYMMLTRNLLYTAITRAKGMVVIVGESDILKRMVKNNYTKERYSMLLHFLTESPQAKFKEQMKELGFKA